MNQLEPAYPLTIQNHSETHALAQVGQVANDYASRGVFADYPARKAANTIHRQAADLSRFVDYLSDIGNRFGQPDSIIVGVG